jgi:4-hydroxy-3-methylbut-2-en-1-yl diphosphate reductase
MTDKIVYYLKPSSFCFWVERAIDMLDKIILENPWDKIYCIHEIVHNPWVVEDFEKKWIIFVENILDIKEKDVVIAFSAHWVNRIVLDYAKNNFKKVYNLECPLVTKVYRELESLKDASIIFYIWKKWHQEAMWLEWYAKVLWKKVYVFSEKEEIPKIKNEIIWVLSQTTLNFEDVKNLIEDIKEIYPDARLPIVSDICKATFERQSVIKNNIDKFDTLVVIGWKNSSNTKELYNIGKNAGKKSFFWEKLEDMLVFWEEDLLQNNLVAITWWASTPLKDISLIYDFFISKWYSLKEINL